MPRMRILTTQEQKDLDFPPVFNHADRKQVFSFPKSLMQAALALRTSSNQIGFLLMCGYFKASKRFFLPRDFHLRDIEAVVRILNKSPSDFIPSDYVKTTRLRHQKLILDYFGFRLFDAVAERLVQTEIATMVRSQPKPKLIFERCLDLLIQKRVTLPHSFLLSDVIRANLKQRKRELNTLVDNHLSSNTRQLLDDLFEIEQEQNRYRLTLLKKQSQSTRPTKIKESVANFQTMSELHGQFTNVLSILELGTEGIRYYAGSVAKSQIFQLTRRTDSDRYVHAIAFITHQFYRLQDNLVEGDRNDSCKIPDRVEKFLYIQIYAVFCFENRKPYSKSATSRSRK